MSYEPKYTSEAKIEALLQLSISDTSVPNSSQVLQWIKEVESRIDELGLGSYSATEYLDVPEIIAEYPPYTWEYRVKSGRFKFTIETGRIVPLAQLKHPIISVTAVYKNDNDPDEAPNWQQLTEGPGENSHYILLTSGKRGFDYALWFYKDPPLIGPKRIKIEYTWGWNVDEDILSDYCTMAVAIKVLLARMGTNQPSGIAYMEGEELGVFQTTNYRERIEILRAEMREIEEKYFPSKVELEDVAAVIV